MLLESCILFKGTDAVFVSSCFELYLHIYVAENHFELLIFWSSLSIPNAWAELEQLVMGFRYSTSCLYHV